MSYAAFGAAGSCPTNAGFNPADGSCYCNPGYDSPDANAQPCTPIVLSMPCHYPMQLRNPVDKKCECPPGTILNPDPTKSDCIPGKWFPGCVDASGKAIPGCFLGMSTKDAVTGIAVGAATGIALTLLFGALR